MTFANNQTIRSLLLASIFLACLTRSTSNEMLSIRYNNTGNYDPGERHRASGACGVIERVANLMSCDIVSDLGMERFSAWTHTKTCELETCRKELYEKDLEYQVQTNALKIALDRSLEDLNKATLKNLKRTREAMEFQTEILQLERKLADEKSARKEETEKLGKKLAEKEELLETVNRHFAEKIAQNDDLLRQNKELQSVLELHRNQMVHEREQAEELRRQIVRQMEFQRRLELEFEEKMKFWCIFTAVTSISVTAVLICFFTKKCGRSRGSETILVTTSDENRRSDEIPRYSDEIQILRQEYSAEKAKFEEEKKSLTILVEKTVQEKNSIEELNAKKIEEFSKKISDFFAEKTELEKELLESKNQFYSFKEKIENDSKEKLEKMAEQKAELEEIVKLKKEIIDRNEKEFRSEKIKAGNEIQVLQQKIKDATLKVNELEALTKRNSKEMERKEAEFRAEISKLKNQIDVLNHKNKELTQKISNFEDQNSVLRKWKSDAISEMQRMEMELAQQIDLVHSYENTISKLRENMPEYELLKQTIQELREKISAYESALEILEKKLAAHNMAEIDYKYTINGLQKEKSRVEKELAEEKAKKKSDEVQRLNEKIAAISSERNSLQHSLAEKIDILSQAEKQFGLLHAAYAEAKTAHEKALEKEKQIEKFVTELQAKISSEENSVKILQQNLSDKNSEVEKLNQNLFEYSQYCAQQTQQIEMMKNSSNSTGTYSDIIPGIPPSKSPEKVKFVGAIQRLQAPLEPSLDVAKIIKLPKSTQQQIFYEKVSAPNFIPQFCSYLNNLEKNFVEFGGDYKWVNPDAKNFFDEKFEEICYAAKIALEKDSVLLRIKSPSYILGDLHGNYRDLSHFGKKLWGMGISFSPTNFVFLGDFVDRGAHSVEVVLHLFLLKVIYPNQVFLVRGNHEFRELNGGTSTNSFLNRCVEFGGNSSRGQQVYEWVNQVFEWLPIAATIDGKIFCCHGGVPRFIEKMPTSIPTDGSPTILDHIASLQRPLVASSDGPENILSDLLWADPMDERAEITYAGKHFGPNSRGKSVVSFSEEALEKFLHLSGCSHLIRAHELQNVGFSVQKRAMMTTIFSSSKYCGGDNCSAALLVGTDGNIRVAVSKPSSS